MSWTTIATIATYYEHRLGSDEGEDGFCLVTISQQVDSERIGIDRYRWLSDRPYDSPEDIDASGPLDQLAVYESALAHAESRDQRPACGKCNCRSNVHRAGKKWFCAWCAAEARAELSACDCGNEYSTRLWTACPVCGKAAKP